MILLVHIDNDAMTFHIVNPRIQARLFRRRDKILLKVAKVRKVYAKAEIIIIINSHIAQPPPLRFTRRHIYADICGCNAFARPNSFCKPFVFFYAVAVDNAEIYEHLFRKIDVFRNRKHFLHAMPHSAAIHF